MVQTPSLENVEDSGSGCNTAWIHAQAGRQLGRRENRLKRVSGAATTSTLTPSSSLNSSKMPAARKNSLPASGSRSTSRSMSLSFDASPRATEPKRRAEVDAEVGGRGAARSGPRASPGSRRGHLCVRADRRRSARGRDGRWRWPEPCAFLSWPISQIHLDNLSCPGESRRG